MHHRSVWVLSCVVAIAGACDGGPDKSPRPAAPAAPPAPAKPEKTPEATPAPPPGPGRLDADLLRAAATAQGVDKIKLEAEADGTLRYLSVYHHDAAALPEPVTRQAEVQFPGGKILRYESEFVAEHGRLFEVEVETRDQQVCEYSAKADGALVYTECHIDPKALPDPVRAALDKSFPGATVKEAEKKTPVGGADEYEVELEIAGKMHELYFKADGTMTRHELVIPAVLEVPVP